MTRLTSCRHTQPTLSIHDIPIVPNPNLAKAMDAEALASQGSKSCPVATTADVRAGASRAVRARASIADGQTWTSSACWHTRKRACLGSGSLASSPAGLGAQYARTGIWSGPEANRIPPVGGRAAARALYAYLSLGTCWDERLKGNLVLLLASPAARAGTVKEAAFKASDGGIRCVGATPQKGMKRVAANFFTTWLRMVARCIVGHLEKLLRGKHRSRSVRLVKALIYSSVYTPSVG
jgi:hypothetical protein